MPVSSTSGWGTLDPNAFMRLFVTQMKYQDPTQPLDTSQMMGQLAQLSTVQQLNAINEGFAKSFRTEQLSLAKDLIGLTVQYAQGGAVASGLVSAATVVNGVVGVTANGAFVPLDRVQGVLAAPAAE